jgi:lipooligosaccharide transport system ATP-binding protein
VRAAAAPAVDVRSVSKAIDGRPVVSGVSFAVARGTCFGLLGPNGAGKTSTLKMIYGFWRPSAGTIVGEGIDVWDDPREAKRRMGVAPQENLLDPDLDVRQNLSFHARYFGLPPERARERIDAVCAAMGLGGHLSSTVAALSSGFRRRLVLARALLTEPSVLILDEPTRGLDRHSLDQVLATFAGMKERGVTLLLATHDREEAELLCDRAALMGGGRILEVGDGREIARHAVRRLAQREAEGAPR